MKSEQLPIFISIILVTRNDSFRLPEIIQNTVDKASSLVRDYEIIIVDNGSTDTTCDTLRKLTSENGIANLQIYSLASTVNDLIARWVGIENSLGDIAIIMDPNHGDLKQLGSLLKQACYGNDIVFTSRSYPTGRRNLIKTFLYRGLSYVTKLSAGIDLSTYSTSLLLVNRRVVNYLLQYPDPHIRFRNLPSTPGFKRTSIKVPLHSKNANIIKLRESFLRGIQLVTSSSNSPLRLATMLSSIGAFSSFFYSIYVVLIWALKQDISPGWVSLSIQQSFMYFFISLVLLVLSEYVLEISRKIGSGPSYFIANEFTSAKITRKERLNVEFDFLESKSSKKFLIDQ